MPLNYINGDEVRITKVSWNLVDVEYYDGTKTEGLEPRRLFPLSGLTKYITLLDEEGKEHAVIRSLDALMPESRKAVDDCLEEYYLIPKITRLIERQEKFGILKWTVDTDKGVRSFDIRNRHSDIKMLYDGRVLVRDSNDNRYEIPKLADLDKSSLRLLNMEL